ncbi:MAG: argininosuccinate lyase, partial [Archaeoglobaceae archaeon]
MNPILYTALKETIEAVEVFTGMLSGMRFRKDFMEQKAREGFTTATELADMLVKDFGIPFRDAHRIIARLAFEGNYSPSAKDIERSAKEIGYEIRVSGERVAEVTKLENIVNGRKTIGGTAKEEVDRMRAMRKEKVLSERRELKRIKRRIENALKLMWAEIETLGVKFDANW